MKMAADANTVIDKINADRYRWVDIHYTDILGYMKCVTIPARNLEPSSFKEGIITVDRNSMFYEGGDYVKLIPDADTFAVIPWEPSTVRLIASADSPLDPRTLLSKTKELEAKLKLSFEVGAEIDFLVMDSLVTDNSHFSYGAYFDGRELTMSQYDGEIELGSRRFQTMNADVGRAIRLQVGDYADLTGVEVVSMHHEKGRLQHEIALGSAGLLKAADDFVTVKHLTKNAAMLVGAIATFVPKLSNYEPMNEVHLNMSAWKGDENAFLDLGGEPLSKTGYYFLAGVMDHARALSAFLLPSTLSYKDIVHVEKVMALGNVVRIPPALKGEYDKRVEYRLADPTINPYMAYAAIVAAGADGIAKKLSFDDKKEIAPPRSLAESLSALLSDHDFLKGVFSDELLHMYIDLKEREIKEVSSKVGPFEVMRYQNI